MPEVPREGKEEDKTVQHILPNTQDKNNREVDKGMDSLKLTVSGKTSQYIKLAYAYPNTTTKNRE